MQARTDGDLSDATAYNRGWEWWLMDQAKKRNPDIVLMVRLSTASLSFKTNFPYRSLVVLRHSHKRPPLRGALASSPVVFESHGHMHTGRSLSACTRAPCQALSWGVPGWIGNGTDFWSEDNIDYHVRFARGLKRHHGHQVRAWLPFGRCVVLDHVVNFLFASHRGLFSQRIGVG